jgi:long-chain acyl-CoA synthetase
VTAVEQALAGAPGLPGEAFVTLPQILAHVISGDALSHALNWREAGYWRQLGTEEFCALVRRLTLGLIAQGVAPGDAVGIIGPSSPWWLAADFAIACAGAVSVPLFTTLCDEHLDHEIRHSGMVAAVVDGDEAWRVFSPHARHVRQVVLREALVGTAKAHVVPWAEALIQGDRLSVRDPGLFRRRAVAVRPEQPATIIHTSGSTGLPKGVVLSHGALCAQVRGAHQCFPIDPARDRALSLLPLAHAFERVVVLTYFAAGVPLHFGDDVKNAGALMREVRPTVVTMVPRLLEKLHDKVAQQVASAHALRRRLGAWAIAKAEQETPEGEGPVAGAAAPALPARRTWTHALADALVYRRLRAALGGNLRYLVVGGAPLTPALERFLLNLGLPLCIGYGLTEAGPVLSVNTVPAHRLGSVGRVFPGVELRIAEDGEIQARSPGLMQGYFRDQAATTAAFTADGWLRTGDLGAIDADGFVTITGRVKELLKTSNGKYVRPVPIEQALGTATLVDQVLVVADGRPCPIALLFAEPEAVRARKVACGEAGTADEVFLAGPAVRAEIDALVAETNAGRDPWERVRAWSWARPTPTIAGGELTPTMKLRRHALLQRHARLIDSLYADIAAQRQTPGEPS